VAPCQSLALKRVINQRSSRKQALTKRGTSRQSAESTNLFDCSSSSSAEVPLQCAVFSTLRAFPSGKTTTLSSLVSLENKPHVTLGFTTLKLTPATHAFNHVMLLCTCMRCTVVYTPGKGALARLPSQTPSSGMFELISQEMALQSPYGHSRCGGINDACKDRKASQRVLSITVNASYQLAPRVGVED
jgi:hypothetical protein